MGNKGTHITVTYDYKLEKVYNKRLKKKCKKSRNGGNKEGKLQWTRKKKSWKN